MLRQFPAAVTIHPHDAMHTGGGIPQSTLIMYPLSPCLPPQYPHSHIIMDVMRRSIQLHSTKGVLCQVTLPNVTLMAVLMTRYKRVYFGGLYVYPRADNYLL